MEYLPHHPPPFTNTPGKYSFAGSCIEPPCKPHCRRGYHNRAPEIHGNISGAQGAEHATSDSFAAENKPLLPIELFYFSP
jgi:hypothetical protein